jgi:hypothetical protein
LTRQDCKFIAAETYDQITLADGRLQPPSDVDEDLVPTSMAIHIIDAFEAVKVQQEHRVRPVAWASVYPSIIDAAERDPEIATMQSELHKGFMAPFRTIVERAKGRGEIPAGKPAADLIAVIVGPLFYRRWFSKEAIDDRFTEATIDAAIKAALRQEPE